jgi:hypothetical protein
MVSRRTVLRGAVAVGGTAVASTVAYQVFAATSMPMTVVNNSVLYPNSAIYMYIVGTNLSTGQQSYVTANGTLTPVSIGLNGPDGYADLSIPLAASGNTTINMPNMSGRVYFSINQKLKFKVVVDVNGKAALQYPAGWVSTDPNYPILHDCIEFTFNNSGMFCNTTMVDMFSIPLAIKLVGAKNQTAGTLIAGGRDKIFNSIAALPQFAPLVVGNKLRVLAPGHGLDAGLFPANYYDAYINDVWTKYATTNLTVQTNAGLFTGRVTNGQLLFDKGVKPIGKPSTRDVLYCDGSLAAPNDGLTGPVAAIVGAAFNRSTLRDFPAQPTTNAAQFYQQSISNHYSRVMHENTVDNKAYGFAFDDVVNFASYIEDNAPTSFTVTLTPFDGTAPGPGPSPTPSPTGGGGGGGGNRNAYVTIQAESFDAQGGVLTETTTDTGGGQDITALANGDWAQYNNVDFSATPGTQFQARVASGAAAGVSGLVEVRLDSRTNAPIASIAVGNTGGWQNWQTIPIGMSSSVTGVHTVFLTFTSGQPANFVNVNWFIFGH